MPNLARSLNPQTAGRLVGKKVRRWAGAKRTHLLEAALVHHKPGRRCLIQYRFAVETGTGTRDDVAILGKIRSRGMSRTSFRVQAVLSAGAFSPDAPDRIVVPEAVGTVSELGMWLQRRIPGETASRLLAGPGGGVLAVRIADAIHKLHRTDVPVLRQHTLAQEIRLLRERFDDLGRRRPDWQGRLARVLQACARLAGGIEPCRECGIHRDFYADQVLIDGEQVVLLDFDLYCRGDPALDVGNFVGHLVEQGLRSHGSPHALHDIAVAMAARYATLAGATVLKAIDSYATLALARHVDISSRIPERRPFTEALLELCEMRLDLSRSPAALGSST